MKKALSVLLILFISITLSPFVLYAATDRMIDKSFPLTMGGKLEVDLDTGGEIEITGWDKTEIAVKVMISGDDADRVDVTLDPGPALFRIHAALNKRRHVDVDLDFTIYVPAKCDIRIDSNGGGVKIEGVEGKLSGKTMGGALELARVKGEIQLETMGGSATVVSSEADGEVSTMGGDVRIRDVKGNLKGSTMGGEVTYENVTGRSASSDDEEMHISTMGGDIKIASTDKKVNAKTLGGDIDVAKAEEVSVTTMGGDINVDDAPAGAKVTTMGGDITVHSAGIYVKAKTMGGDIEIGSIDGKISATTMGGDVTAKMVGDPKTGDRSVDIRSMGGDIELVVPAGLSMKFDLEIEYTKDHKGKAKIESDFTMNIEETPDWERHHGSLRKIITGTGSVGDGEHLIKIRTINGNITLKKGL